MSLSLQDFSDELHGHNSWKIPRGETGRETCWEVHPHSASSHAFRVPLPQYLEFIFIFIYEEGEGVCYSPPWVTGRGVGRWQSPAEKLPLVSLVRLETAPGVLQSAWELFPQVNEILNQSNTAAVIPCREISPGQHLQGHILLIFEGFLLITQCFTIFLLNREPSLLQHQ